MTMESGKHHFKKDCIEVKKVFDQCITDELVSAYKCIEAGQVQGLTCTPKTWGCSYLGKRDHHHHHHSHYKIVSINQWVTVQLSSNHEEIGEITLSGKTDAKLWVPHGTKVECSIIDVGDCTAVQVTDVLPCSSDQVAVFFSVPVCKEIQVTAWVKMLVPSCGYCEFEHCDPGPPPLPCPPKHLFPKQKCYGGPWVTIKVGGSDKEGVKVNISRDGETISQTTDRSGVATFTGIGGFAGGIDTITFMEPDTGTKVKFALPLEFPSTDGKTYDCETVCTIEFDRTNDSKTETPEYKVTIDGVEMTDNG